jgi:hypothetical protein
LFSQTFFLLQLEGYITRSSLSTGLTEIRNANIGEKGRYYSGFFQLAIALERMCKLCLVLDYMESNRLKPPGKSAIMRYGHNLQKLYAAAEQVATRRAYSRSPEFVLSALRIQILEFLCEFAQSTRYTNLDGLASGTPGKEPLEAWQDILSQLIQTNVSPSKQERIIRTGQELGQLLEEFTTAQIHDLKSGVLSIRNCLTIPQLLHEGSRFAVWEVSKIFRPVIDLIDELANEARNVNVRISPQLCSIPDMGEFYWFIPNDRKSVLRKKRWL